MDKKTIVVLFGGQSSEHEISCISAATIIENINKDHYQILLIGITREGHWLKVDSLDDIRSGAWQKSKISAVLSPDAERCILLIDGSKLIKQPVDVIFPALHGLCGEDGTVQGIFELAKMPYVGCGVLASAVAMDKLYTKIIVDTLGIRQASYVPVLKQELVTMDKVIKNIEEKLSYPVFIKPSNAGSSRGISKAANRDQLIIGLKEAASHDRKILVEETLVGREVECAVLGGFQPKASGVGEILAAADFYDFDSKYNNPESRTVLGPVLPGNATEVIRKAAVDIFKAIDGYGIARVDFFVEDATGDVVFNEINTMPGFTAISMYPILWENEGIGKPQIIEKLIQSALARGVA